MMMPPFCFYTMMLSLPCRHAAMPLFAVTAAEAFAFFAPLR